ncbi:MAG: hypothetical protein HRT88_17505, partial [Lentisphaeraceae bacterium]|nr:hypothetical protein [Lentisphaeraceae bacterium]
FKFNKWSKKYGQPIDINNWFADNPHPFGRRFNPELHYFHGRYHTSLGPLGVRTKMHDMTWAYRYKRQMSHFPPALQDAHGPIVNAMLVDNVVAHGPAARYLKKGDYILEIEGQPLKSAQSLNRDHKYSDSENRGLEIHAGQMIDQAEGRGKIKIKLLRLPKDYQLKKIATRTTTLLKKIILDPQILTKVTIQLPANIQLFTIKSDSSDLTQFMNPTLVNDQGLRVPLYKMPKGKLFKRSCRDKYGPRSDRLHLTAAFHLQHVVPLGKWKFVAEIKSDNYDSAPISFTYTKRAKLAAELEPYYKTVEFAIPRIGSFGKTFDPNCAKVRNYTAIMARRLAIAQSPNGSWPTVKAYTSPAFYTSMCGLGLLAENNPAYERHIRKAAHYIAYSGTTSNWTWARGIHAMFLGEYYLRTKDKSILEGYALALRRCEQAILPGYVAGHAYHDPGYGGGGHISGSGVIACAMAIAEHTPALFTHGTALNMMEGVQSLAIRGSLPYGRKVGRRSEKMKFDLSQFIPHHGGTAGIAPYYMAAKISGGSKYFTDIVSRRFLTPPYGSTDHGHATHTMPFTLGNIAISLCSPEAHKANMEAFLWKLTTHRGFDGLIVNNSNPLEFHSGEGVMGKPWWSTGAWLVMMNAHKRNMAMTGKKEYMATKQKDLPLVHDADLRAYRYVLRQWSLVEANLGSKTPASVSAALQELINLKKTGDYGKEVMLFVKRNGPKCAADIARIRLKDKLVKNYCMEIVLGITHDIHLNKFHGNDNYFKTKQFQRLSSELQKAKKAEVNSIVFTINSRTLAKDLAYSHPDSTSLASSPLANLFAQGTLRIVDRRGRPVKGVPKVIVLDKGKEKYKFNLLGMEGVDKLYAYFDYECAGVQIKYKKELLINHGRSQWDARRNLRTMWISGTLKRNFIGWGVDLILPNGTVYHGTYHTKTPRVFDAQNKPIKDYMDIYRTGQNNYPIQLPLAKGN